MKSILCLLCALPAAAQPTLIDFAGLQHGEILTDQFAAQGVNISAINNHRSFDIAAVFDTSLTSTRDPDLEGPPWSGGNLAADAVELGGAVIIAENRRDDNNDGILDRPDDEGRRPAGSVTFAFDFVAASLGFDVIDTEGVVIELSSIEFIRDGATVLEIGFSEFIDNQSDFYDASISFGDNSANRIDPIAVSGGFDTFRINAGGSSAYDTFVIGGRIPAPSAMATLAIGLIGYRRRSSKNC